MATMATKAELEEALEAEQVRNAELEARLSAVIIVPEGEEYPDGTVFELVEGALVNRASDPREALSDGFYQVLSGETIALVDDFVVVDGASAELGGTLNLQIDEFDEVQLLTDADVLVPFNSEDVRLYAAHDSGLKELELLPGDYTLTPDNTFVALEGGEDRSGVQLAEIQRLEVALGEARMDLAKERQKSGSLHGAIDDLKEP